MKLHFGASFFRDTINDSIRMYEAPIVHAPIYHLFVLLFFRYENLPKRKRKRFQESEFINNDYLWFKKAILSLLEKSNAICA